MNSPRRLSQFSALMFIATVAAVAAPPLIAQDDGPANYRLAARFAPYKIQDLIYSTSVNPRWIEGSESFWYEWETSDGTFYNIVDPIRHQAPDLRQ